MTYFLCKTGEIADPGCRGFEVKTVRKTVSVFVVLKDTEYFAYYNKCPHTGVNLEWQEHQFLDLDKTLIQCATHDALFLIDSGKCIAGPCTGDSLQPIPVEIINDEIHIRL